MYFTLPAGEFFITFKKDRLLTQGISELHVLKGDLQDVEKYRAQNFLNEKIQEYDAVQEALAEAAEDESKETV